MAAAGWQITLLERDRIGGEASSAAAGILCPQLEAERPSPLLDLGMASLGLYRDFVRAAAQESGIDPELDLEGTLLPDLTSEDANLSERISRWQIEAGLPVERLSA